MAGRDVLLDALRRQLPLDRVRMDYRELDPDIFGEELDGPAYAEVERIAAVGLVLQKAREAASDIGPDQSTTAYRSQ